MFSVGKMRLQSKRYHYNLIVIHLGRKKGRKGREGKEPLYVNAQKNNEEIHICNDNSHISLCTFSFPVLYAISTMDTFLLT
jgi:hypothetical protein